MMCARMGREYVTATRAKTVAVNVTLDTRAASRATVGALDAARFGATNIGGFARREGARLGRA